MKTEKAHVILYSNPFKAVAGDVLLSVRLQHHSNGLCYSSPVAKIRLFCRIWPIVRFIRAGSRSLSCILTPVIIFKRRLTFHRDDLAHKLQVQLLVRYVQDSIDQGRAIEETGPNASRNGLQTVTLLDALAELKFEAAMGGARRDEEKDRAKERFFSTVMRLVSGIPRINDRNSGRSITAARIPMNISGSSLLVTGRKWIFGSMSSCIT